MLPSASARSAYGPRRFFKPTAQAPGLELTVLLPKTESGVTATSDLKMNESLGPAFRISGTITGGQPGRVTAGSGSNIAIDRQVDPVTGKYLIVAPAGNYTRHVTYRPA